MMARNGGIMVSFPPRETHKETADGPVIIKPASASEYRSGTKMLEAAHTIMTDIHRRELAAAGLAGVTAPEFEAGLPTSDEARAADLAELEAASAWLRLAAGSGDREALADLLKVQERRAKLLGLDLPPAAQPSGQAGAPVPRYIRPVRPDQRSDAAAGPAGADPAHDPGLGAGEGAAGSWQDREGAGYGEGAGE